MGDRRQNKAILSEHGGSLGSVLRMVFVSEQNGPHLGLQACILCIINSGLGDNGIRRGRPVPEGGRFPHRLQGGSLTVPALLA